MRNDITVVVAGGPDDVTAAADGLLAAPVDLTVTTAGDVAAVLSALPGADAVVTAATLPDGDAVALLEAVRERTPELPVVVLASDPETVTAAVEAGATDCRAPDDEAGWALLAARLEDAVAIHRVEHLAAERGRPDAPLRPLRELALKGAAIDVASVGVVITDPTAPDNPIVYANEGFERLTGYAAEDVEGRNCRFLQGEGTDPAARDEFRAAIDAERPAVVELLNYRADGTPFWNRVEIAPVRDGSGDVVNFIGFQQDATDRREHERALRELHDATRELVAADGRQAVAESVTDAVTRVLGLGVAGVRLLEDGELRATAETERFASLLCGGPACDVDGDSPAAVTFRAGETRRFPDAVGGDEPAADAIFTPLGEHGVLGVGAPAEGALGDADCELLETLAANAVVALDRIDEHERVRRRERELARERDRHAALFEENPDPLVYCTFDGDVPVVESVNPAFEATFGVTEADARGEDLDRLLAPPDRLEEARAISRDSREGVGQDNEVERLAADGRRQFLLRTVQVGTDDEPAAYAVYVDVTERKRHEQRLAVLNRVLRHNLRNDMNVVLGSADEVARLAETPAVEEHLDTVRETARSLLERSAQARLVQESLGDGADHGAVVDLAAVASEAADQVGERAPAATVTTRLPDAAPVEGCSHLPTAVRELVTNAVEHAGPSPTVEVAVETVDGGERVRLAVTDDGPGIPDHELSALDAGLETQLDHASGLGLWLVRWTAENVGGALTFETPEDGGTRAVLSLRAAGSPPGAGGEAGHAAEGPDAAAAADDARDDER